MVLITAGEDHEGQYPKAAKKAREKDIVIYAIGYIAGFFLADNIA